jgi:hypothetical protein
VQAVKNIHLPSLLPKCPEGFRQLPHTIGGGSPSPALSAAEHVF